MRYIILKTEISNDGSIAISGMHRITHRPSGISVDWINVNDAKTNTVEPAFCDFLSFEEKETAEEILLDADLDLDLDNFCIIGVEID